MQNSILLDLKEISYSMGGKSILPPQNLKIVKGRHLLLLGPSGCGKTTLLNLMSGLLKATSGSLSYLDRKYEEMTERELDSLRAQNFGFIFQRLHLIGHLSALQNIALAQSKDDGIKIKNLLADLGLADMAERRARELSLGEAQRVAIARAVINEPEIIFADEPSSALDDANTQNVMKLIFTHAEKTGSTVIAATHDARIRDYFSDIWEIR